MQKFRKTARLPKIGAAVKTKKKIADAYGCRGFLVKDAYVDSRRPDEAGEYVGHVPGTGGDVWWIKHLSDRTVGAYVYTELTDVRKP